MPSQRSSVMATRPTSPKRGMLDSVGLPTPAVILWRGRSYYQLAAIECLCVSAAGARFHPAKPHQTQERVPVKPVFPDLRFEAFENIPELFFTDGLIQLQKNAGPPQIAVVFWNLVLENHVIPERVPCQFVQQPVILVRISVPVRENQIGRYLLLELLEYIFYLARSVREISIPEIIQSYAPVATG